MKKLSALAAFMIAVQFCFGQLKVINPVCENLSNPIGLDLARPQFSWQLSASKKAVMQTAYEVRVSEEQAALVKEQNLVWNSGKVSSDRSVGVSYGGKPLESSKKYYWQVRVWDNSG